MVKKYITKKIFFLLFSMIGLSIFSSILTSIVPTYYKKIIDEGILLNNMKLVVKILFLIVILSLLNSMIKIFNNISINKIGLYISKDLKETTIKKVFNSPMNFFDGVSNGELVQRIKEIDAISSLFNPQLLTMIVSIGTCVIALIKMIYIDYRFLFVYASIFPMLTFVSYKFSNKYKALTHELVFLTTNYSQIIHESISGINELKSNNLATKKQNKLNQINNEIYYKTKRQNTIFAFNSELLIIINLISSIGIVFIFSILFKKGDLSIGHYTEITQYSAMILAPAQMFSSFLTIIQPMRVLLERLKFFDSVSSQQEEVGESLRTIKYIQFQEVSFSYKNNMKIISDLSFNVGENEKILINGKNGSGKTTIIKLLLRLYDEYQGQILLNKRDSKEYSLKDIRNEIAVVFQESFLFDGSLQENIICGSNASKDEVLEALKISGLIDNMNIEVNELLFFPIVEGGKNLSGGQKRMISIARALVKKPSVLVLDEPTTFLDIESKEQVITFIKSIEDIIVIIITHDNELKNELRNIVNHEVNLYSEDVIKERT